MIRREAAVLTSRTAFGMTCFFCGDTSGLGNWDFADMGRDGAAPLREADCLVAKTLRLRSFVADFPGRPRGFFCSFSGDFLGVGKTQDSPFSDSGWGGWPI